MDAFPKYYPSTIFLRDKYGRSTLRQAELASGNKTYNFYCCLSKACTNSHGHNLQSRTPLVSEATKLERVPDSMQHDKARGMLSLNNIIRGGDEGDSEVITKTSDRVKDLKYLQSNPPSAVVLPVVGTIKFYPNSPRPWEENQQ